MNKIYIVGLLLVLSAVLFGCSLEKNTQLTCEQQGYVKGSDVNELINLTNKLIDVSNVCFASQNLTPLTHIRYIDNSTNIQ